MSEYSQDPTDRESRPIYLKLKSDLMYFCYRCNEQNMDFTFSDLESPNRNWNWVANGAECTGRNNKKYQNNNWLVGVSQVARYDNDPYDSIKPYFVDVHLMKLGEPNSGETLKIFTIEQDDILVDILEKNHNEYFGSSAYDAKPTEIIDLIAKLYDLDNPKDHNLQLRKITSQSNDALMRRYSNEVYAFLNCCDSFTYPTQKQRVDDIKRKFIKYVGSTISTIIGLDEE